MARTESRVSWRRISLFFHGVAQTVVTSADRALDASDSTLKSLQPTDFTARFLAASVAFNSVESGKSDSQSLQ
jgi:hypothetical protein